MSEQLRKEFEAWAEAYGHDISRSETNPDEYHDLITELAFDVWKAARAELERNVEPVAAPAGYFCEPYLNKPGLFEQVFNGFDDPDVIPLYRDPNGRIAALEREVERLKEQQFTDLCNSADVKRLISVVAFPDNYADQNFSEMAKRVLAKMEQNIKALAAGEAG